MELEQLREAVEAHPRRQYVKVLESDRNGGFGYGNNIAIRAALAAEQVPDYLYFLNPDAIPKAGALTALLDFLDNNPNVAIAGSLLCDETDAIQTSLFRFPSFYSEIEQASAFRPVTALLRRHLVALDTPSSPTDVDWVAGTSFAARTSVFRDVGLFDETFFLYWEETELCHRIKDAGFDIYGVPEAIAEHVGGVTTGLHDDDKRIPPYWFASRNYFFRTTGTVRNLVVLNVVVVFCLLFWRLHDLVRWRPFRNPHYVRDFIRYSFRRVPKASTTRN